MEFSGISSDEANPAMIPNAPIQFGYRLFHPSNKEINLRNGKHIKFLLPADCLDPPPIELQM